jgi:FkbM family methyltransferase
MLKAITIQALNRLLPDAVKRSLFHVSFNLAQTEFQNFAFRYANAPNMEFGLRELARRGYSPRTVIDVGAFEGDWSAIVRKIWPQCAITMIEPNPSPKLFGRLSVLQAVLHTELLGASDGEEVTFYSMLSGSSVLWERSGVPRNAESRKLKTLDSLRLGTESSLFLKLDTQGYEIEVLKGGEGTLQRADTVLLEVSLIEINERAPLLHEVISFMAARNFVAYDILEFHRRPLDGALNQIDILFVRPGTFLLADKRHYA